jgi:tRNA pseudouridine55 synthase
MPEQAKSPASVAPDGLVVVDKPAGWTSHDVVGKLRRLAGTRKVGHAGTLDPMATGVLVCGVGRATRLLGYIAGHDKSYEATIRLGQRTVTDDAEGEVVAAASAPGSTAMPTLGLDDDAIRRAVGSFVGEIDQVPSAVSAVKVEGKRAYARVRAGEDVQLDPRRVTIESIDFTDVRRPPSDAIDAVDPVDLVDVDVTVTCSTGTYVRAIARDLGQLLGVGGHLTMLRRTRVGGFGIDGARTIAQLETRLEVVPLAQAVRATFPSRSVMTCGTAGRSSAATSGIWWVCSTAVARCWRSWSHARTR